MRFLAVDDEILALDELVFALHDVRPDAEILQFTWPQEALEAAERTPVDVAFLDIQMRGISGLQMAVRLKEIKPDMHIIFVTGYSQYAVDAFSIHATGFLLKPVTREAIKRELTFIYGEQRSQSGIRVQTFGGFELFVDGKPIKFGRAKAKELLAYLVDRRGASVSAGDICAALFEGADDKASKTYLRQIWCELKKTLTNAGVGELLAKGHNSYAVVPDEISCDFYRFLEGDPVAVNIYQNDYLPAYSWAEIRNAELGFHNKPTR